LKQFRRAALFCAALSTFLVLSPAFATNGYFTHGTGTKNKSMAGAGLASPEGSIFMANNPAAAVFATGNLDLGVAVFSPLRSYTSSDSLANGNGGAFTIGPNNLDSDSNYFYIPHIAYSWAIGTDSAFGLAFYGRGGMNTDWNGGTASFDPDGPGPAPVGTFPGTFGAGKAGVDLSQAFLDVTYASKLSDNFAWGISAVVAVQAFEANGVLTFAPYTESFAASGGTQLPTNLSNNGHEFSTGFGGKIGIQAALSDNVSVAASYQTEIGMSEFDKYSDLFAEGGGFDIPANLKAGLTFAATERLSVSLDVEHTWFSDVGSVGNPLANLFACPTVNPTSMALENCLGGNNGAGFGWDDMTTYKVGLEWTTGSDWTWRAGYSNGSQPIPTSEALFNILAPAVIEDHVAFGFSKATSSGGKWNFSFMYAPEGKVAGINPFDPTQTIELKMHQFEVELGYTWSFN
jgi:long-chain fatty acid transport protein